MNIKIEDYLDGDEIKEIAREAVSANFSKHFIDEKSVERILSNLAYDLVYQKVDEVGGQALNEYLPSKVKEIIEGLTEFNLFKKPDAWSRESNSGYQILERALLENKELISQKVISACQSAPDDFFRDLSDSVIIDVIKDTFTGNNYE